MTSVNKPDTSAQQQALNQFIHNKEKPVVIFSLSWCQFCRAAKGLFTAMEIPHEIVELDIGEHAQSGLANTLRSALLAETDSSTLPQVFIGGEAVGGFNEAYGAYNSGELQGLLDKNEVSYNPDAKF